VKPGVVGYSALMEQDEAGTFDRLRAHRKEFFEPEIERHHGRPSAMPMSQTMSG
jgi:class 3 adenylate cyclase